MDCPASSTDRLVVGLDGSAADVGVLEWATREAAARRCSVRVVSAPRGDQKTFLDEAVDATLLIVGGEPVANGERRSSCPVAVVRGVPKGSVQRIIVGVDSSNAAAAALDWAVIAARHHGAVITVIHAWQQSERDARSLRGKDLRRADARCIADLAADMYEAGPVPTLGRRAVEGPAAQVLLAASGQADLLVVGSRGPSGYRTLQFGSVALAAVQGAQCPVVVVHPRLSRSVSADPSNHASAARS